MTKGFRKRDIERPVPPHPAPHDRHEKRHKYVFYGLYQSTEGWGVSACCDKSENHPIHTGRYKT